MLRISKLTDYGVVLVTHLARFDDARFSASSLASATQIPEPTVRKVLKTLARGDVVQSSRGVAGGYRLARPADEISVAEVITSLEGPIAVTECSDDTVDSGCEHEPSCGVRANWQQINNAVYTALDAISIREMIAEAPLVTLFRSREDAKRSTKKAPVKTIEKKAMP